MDIASLLAPCDDAPARNRHGGANSAAAIAPPVVSLDLELVALDQQIVALQSSTPPRKAPALGVMAHDKKKHITQAALSGKRKRKRRLTVKQLQVKSENQRDESQLYNLTLDINDLKQQVCDYMVRKSIHETRTLVARQRYDAGVVRTTQHYFDLLSTGHREWEPQEAAFFASTFDPDVAVKSVASSVAFLFNKWRMYKMLLRMKYFGISSIRILVSDAESCVVECEGEFEGTLTLAAVEALFPHILQDQRLLEKVVDRRLVCPTRTLIYFDAGGRIVQYDAHADMFAGLNRILASTPMDVISLMSNTHISSQGSNERVEPHVGDRCVEVVEDDGESATTCQSGWSPQSPASSTASSSSSLSPSASSKRSPRSSMSYILS